MLKNRQSDDEIIAERMNRFVVDVADRTYLKRSLALFFLLNVLLWAGVVLIALYQSWILIRLFSRDQGKGGLILMGIPFGLGLYITYLFLRMLIPDVEDVDIDSDFMSGYNYSRNSQRRWYVWLGAVLGGVANALSIVLVGIYLLRGF